MLNNITTPSINNIIVSSLRSLCEEHAFYMNDKKKNEIYNESGEHCGFIGYFPSACSITVDGKGSVSITVEHERECGYPHSVLYMYDGKYSIKHPPYFDNLTKKQKECVISLESVILEILESLHLQ